MKRIQRILLAFMLGALPIQVVWADNKNALAEYYNLCANKRNPDGYMDISLDKVKLLVEQGADINARIKEFGDGTALMFTSTEGHLEIVKYLISKGADINAKITVGGQHKGLTALMFASMYGHLEVVKYLVSKGADVNAKSDSGMTALNVAKTNAIKEVLRNARDKK